MTLQIALQQIQTPSFFGRQYETVGQSRNRFADRAKMGAEKRDAIRCELFVQTRPIDAAALCDLTGFSLQSIRHHMALLVDSGEARRVERLDSLVFWEAVK